MGSIDGLRSGTLRITSPGAADTWLPAAATRPVGDGAFSVGLDAGTRQMAAGGTWTAAEIVSLPAGALAVQEYGSEPAADRAARRQGMLLLRQLDRLQLSLLGEGPDGASLERLASLAAALEEAVDADIEPGLERLLRALALRARLELVRPRGGRR